MNPDIQMLADKAAEKIRGGYYDNIPRAINSALKEAGIADDDKERLRHEVARELNRRSQLRRKKNKKMGKISMKRLEEALRKERVREAVRLAFDRGDHLLPDP
ncbi:MAG: hypothetical protein Q8R36_02905 [bacterium]|nr:hypothetical protein [bacterium]